MNFELNLVNAILLLVTGFCCGVLSGFFGVGGAFILTPTLNIFGLPMVNAVATGISFTVISSTIGGIKHYFQNNILLKIGLIVGIITLFGVRASQPLVIYLDSLNIAGLYIRIVYIVLLIILGGLPLIKKDIKRGNKNVVVGFPPFIEFEEQKISIWNIIVLGLFVGFLQGFLGVGGGFVLVPLFILILKMKTHQAVGTSLLVIFISSIFGTYLYILSGMVIYYIVFILSLGTFFGVNFGVKAIQNIDGKKLQRFYSIFLLLASLGIILRQFELVTVSLVYTLSLVFAVTLLILLKYYFGLRLFSKQTSL